MITESLKQFIKEDSYNYICNNYSSLKELLNATATELESIPGLGKVKSRQLQAILKLSKELLMPNSEDFYIKQPKDIYEYLKYMSLFTEENLMLLCLNTKNKVIYSKLVSKGTINSSLVHPREVFTSAIKIQAASIVIVHNHPSGDPSPSSEDISITTRLRECSKIIGIDLLDHVIIGAGKYVSLKERGIM